jgi:hypothetical protein
MIVGIPPDYMGKLQNNYGLNIYGHNNDNEKSVFWWKMGKSEVYINGNDQLYTGCGFGF